MRHKIFLLLLFALCRKGECTAQVFGGNPLSSHWKQIGNDTFQVIYPAEQLGTARKIASAIAWQSRENNTLGVRTKKIAVVLQPEVVYSNGYVGLGPFRSEFYLMPPMDPFSLGSQDWPVNLAIHEFRHVQQYNNFNVGLSRTMGTLFGQNGRALANAMAIPDWFFEGDAVYNETKLSRQGRGRLPQFMNAFAALFLDGKNYGYEKWRNGSYTDYVPNHYPLGYILVAYGYEKYGSDFWKKVTQDAAAYRHLFYPFQSAVRKYAGIPFGQFVQDAFGYYREHIPESIKDTSILGRPNAKGVVNYRFPLVSGDTLLTLRTSYEDIPRFVAMDTNGVRTIAVQSITYDNYFSSNGKNIVYSAWTPDLRWGNRQYSQLRSLDLKTGKETPIGKKTKWFNPDIAPSGDSLLVVCQNNLPGNTNAILLLDRNGNTLDSLKGANGELFSYPKLYKAGILSFVRKLEGAMSLRYYRLDNKKYDVLIPFGNRLLGYPNLQKDTLFFSCSVNGKDGLWAFDLLQRRLFLVAQSATGIYGGGYWNGKNIGSVFTAAGFDLKSLPANWTPASPDNKDSLPLLYFSRMNGRRDLLDSLPYDTATWQPRKYPAWTHPFNFHSLQPEWSDPDYTIALYGENVLNTLQSQLFYHYNRNEKYSSVGFSSTYGGWYLMPVLSVSRTFNRQAVASTGNFLRWNEWNAAGGLYLPLNFSGGKMYRYLSFQSLLYLNNVDWINSKAADRTVTYWSNTLSFRSYSQQAVQQIYPHTGYALGLQYRYGLSGKAYQYLASGTFYLPGLFQTHSLVLSAAYQRRDTLGYYTYSNGFPISRGYQLINYPQMWKLGANYHFPILYPDKGWANIVYLLRLRGNVFYDHSQLRSLRYQQNYLLRSAGAELYFDTQWWNQLPLTLGVRYSYMVDHHLMGTGASRWEVILPVSIF